MIIKLEFEAEWLPTILISLFVYLTDVKITINEQYHDDRITELEKKYQRIKVDACSCENGIITCPGCNGEKSSKFGVCAGCMGEGEVKCGKCGGK